MAQFYGYRGYIGIEGFHKGIDLEEKEGQEITDDDLSPAVMNDPLGKDGGQYICDMSQCFFNEEAIKVLKNIKQGNSLSPIEMFKEDDMSFFSWLGAPMVVVDADFDSSENYDVSLLNEIEPTDLEVPEGLKQYIDSLIDDVPDYTGNDL